MNSTFLRILPAIVPMMALASGCLTIEENYTFKKNGSGTMEYVVDMSELGKLMEGFKEVDEGSAKSSGSMDLGDEVAMLKALPGISKVKLDNKKEWVQRISFAFKDVAALNGALNQLLKDSTGVRKEFFRWEGATLVRTNNDHARQLGMGMAGEDDEEGVDLAAILGAMKYRYSFKFADKVGDLGTSERVQAQRPKAKVFTLETDFATIAEDPGALDLRITLDR
ncbi:MAG: hypothetical protein RBT71_07880 [Flavobacteriales bacterium]|jgi:hypothetical protein|nr:hypothetical protein [Flavobacteriales bacterium]